MTSRPRRFSELRTAPDFGRWFDALVALMSDGDPPLAHYRDGEELMRAGEPAECFLVLIEGSARVIGTFGDTASLAVGPGALLGELGLLFEGRRRRTVVASSPTTAIVGTRPELEAAQQVEEIGAHIASVAGRRLAEGVEPIPATTAKGLDVLLRPLLPSDRASYFELFGRASVDTLYKRFFVARRPPDAVIERLLHIDYVDHFAWVAITADAPHRPVGIFRLIVDKDDPSAAEVALAVEDGHQGQGLGTLFLAFAGAWAGARRLTTLTAHVLTENRPARSLFGKINIQWQGSDAGVMDGRVEVAEAAALLDAGTRRRVDVAARQLEDVACLADA